MDQQDSNMNSIPDDEALVPTADPQIDGASLPEIYEKSQSLVAMANKTFRELYQSLDNEQSKLLELEERRRTLKEEMIRLKAEIEEEKNIYHENLKSSSSLKIENNDTADEMDETEGIETARDVTISNTQPLEDKTQDIKAKLQAVVDQCVQEQNKSADAELNTTTE